MTAPDTHPEPLGKILPDLLGSYSYNTDDTPDWLMQYCPNCMSDHVCCINPTFNPGLGNRWYCVSCGDSWEYKLDE